MSDDHGHEGQCGLTASWSWLLVKDGYLECCPMNPGRELGKSAFKIQNIPQMSASFHVFWSGLSKVDFPPYSIWASFNQLKF